MKVADRWMAIARYLRNIGRNSLVERFDCRVGEEGGGGLSKRRHAREKNIHRTKGNVMKSVRLDDALATCTNGGRMKDLPSTVSLWEDVHSRNSASPTLCFRTSDNRRSSSSLVPSPFSAWWWRIEAGGQRREERRVEWMRRRRKERMSCLPLDKTRSANSRGQKKLLLSRFPCKISIQKSSLQVIRSTLSAMARNTEQAWTKNIYWYIWTK